MSEFWWGLIWLSIFIPLMFLWGFTLWDVFSRHDIGGWSKGLWAFAIVLFPLVGMLVYFIARPRNIDAFGGAYGNAATYPYGAGYQPQYQNASGPSPAVNDLDTINRLHDSGTLSDEEYTQLKERMASSQEPRAA